MPAIFWLQCLSLASSSRAWPAPTMLNLMAVSRRIHTECLLAEKVKKLSPRSTQNFFLLGEKNIFVTTTLISTSIF